MTLSACITIADSRLAAGVHPAASMEQTRVVHEECRVPGKEPVYQVGQLIHAGNVRRIIVKDDKGGTLLEIAVSVATEGVVAVPVLAGPAAPVASVGRQLLDPRKRTGILK